MIFPLAYTVNQLSVILLHVFQDGKYKRATPLKGVFELRSCLANGVSRVHVLCVPQYEIYAEDLCNYIHRKSNLVPLNCIQFDQRRQASPVPLKIQELKSLLGIHIFLYKNV